MTTGEECEFKFRIASRADFIDLRDAPWWGTRSAPSEQINHYFDTKDLLLARSRVLLRIREEEGKCVLTLKCGREVAPGNFDSLEIEHVLSRDALEEALERPRSLLELRLEAIEELVLRLGRPPLEVAGRLVNERVRREVDGWVLEVDRARFPDGSESYELEVETRDGPGLRAWVDCELRSRGLRLEPQRLTKFEQLLAWQASRCGGAGDPGEAFRCGQS